MNCQDCSMPMSVERTHRTAKVTFRIERCSCGSRFESEQKIARRLPSINATGSAPAAYRGPAEHPPIGTGGPPARTAIPSVGVEGVGGGLSSGLSGSDPNLPSGPSQPPDLQGDRPPAREPDPDPNDIRLPGGQVTGWNLAKVFGRVRGRDCPGGFGWTIPKSSPDKAEGIVTEANADPSVRADIVPTMALLFAKAKAGKLGAGTDIQDPTVAFGWWVSKFTTLREELHGHVHRPPSGNNGHHDPRIGHARAEVKPRPTGDVEL